MIRQLARWCCTALALGGAGVAGAGVFFGTVDCRLAPPEDNFCAQGLTRAGQAVTPFGIVHPPGFSGPGGPLVVKICVEPSSASLVGPVQRAIATWNASLPTVGNCPAPCLVVEEAEQALTGAIPYHAESVLLHELGHCALGLDHPNLVFDPPGTPEGRIPTSFTMSYGGSSSGIDAGPDGIPGSFDDEQLAQGGMFPDSVPWFRRVDNNPVLIDSTVIDLDTYSRAASNLPAGHGWAANGNRRVAESLGAPNTNAVMYSHVDRGQRRTRLTADDVSMLKMAGTGVDRMAGTADDYTVALEFVADCVGADVAVNFLPLGETFGLAACGGRIELSFAQNPFLAQNYTLVPRPGQPRLDISLNDFHEWDTREEVFVDGFETGDLSGWSTTFVGKAEGALEP